MPDDPTGSDQQQTDAGATAVMDAVASPEAPQLSRVDISKAFASFDEVFGGASAQSDGSSKETPQSASDSKPPAATSAPADTAATAQDGADDADDDTPEGATAETETPAADGKPQEKKPSRAERIHLEYQEKLAAKDQELARLKADYDKATGTLSAEAQREQQTREQFLDAYGPDEEYERLTIANNKGLALTPDEYDNLQRWTTTRELARPFMAQAETRAQAIVAEARQAIVRSGEQFADYLRTQLDTRTQKYGLDPETVMRAEYGGLIDHAVSVTEQRKDAEYAPKLQERDTKISQIEAQLREAQDALKGYRPELLRGGHPSEVVANPRPTYSQRNLTTPLVDDWTQAFDTPRSGAAAR